MERSGYLSPVKGDSHPEEVKQTLLWLGYLRHAI